MSEALKLAFYKAKEHYSFKEAQQRDAVYYIAVDQAEAHKGLTQSAIYDAIMIIDETKRCFGFKHEPLIYVLLDGDTVIDCG